MQSGILHSAWWSWTAPTDGTLTIDTNGSNFDTYLTLATGSAVDVLTVLDQDDDDGTGLQSLITLNVIGGTEYQIAVDGYSSETGNIVLNLSFTTVMDTDLALENLLVLPSMVTNRQFTSCGFDIRNNGPTPLSSESITTDYYLFTNTTFGDADDRKIGDTGFTLSIASGVTYHINLSSTGLDNMVRFWTEGLVSAGNYYVFAEVRLTSPPPTDPVSSNNYDRTDSMITYDPPLDVIYVDDDATAGADNGLSWDDAFIYLQDALDFAESSGGLVSEIWVAEGIYKPDQGSTVVSGDRNASFQLLNGVAVIGGYAGFGAPDPNAKDVGLYETILSGDLNGDDGPNFVNNIENSYNVVTGNSTDTTAVLDGFTITSGNANGSDVFAEESGGGMNILGGSPTIVDSTFRGNIALQGGGMFVYISNPILTNCTFFNNFAVYGGGMYNHTNSNPILTYCTFDGNYAGEFGGAMINIENSCPILTSTVFSGNYANYGGGMTNYLTSSPELTNCTFSGNSAAYYGAGMYNQMSSPVLTGCTFIGNSAAYYGGGMHNQTNSNPILTDCTFNGNYAGEFGGAMINIENSSPTLTNTVFSSNYANCGGGMTNYSSSSPELTNCTFSGNSAAYYGAGMYNQTSSPVLTSCTFIGNSATYYGGGMHNQTNSNPILTDCTFDRNYAGEYGGAMANIENSSPKLTDTVFSGNYANYGGGMTNYSSSNPELTNCTFSGNSAAYYGAGMYNQMSSPVLTNCTFSENSATYYGGGMFNQTQSSPVLTNCIFNGNYAGEYGGGLTNYENSSPTLTNTLFSGNTANYGGGMANYLGSNPTLTNCTLSGNSAVEFGGGIINLGDSNPTITNSIFWLNADSGGTNESSQIYGGTPVVNYSCIQGWSGSFGGIGNIGDDPMFVRNPDDGGDGWGVGGNDDYGDLRLLPGSPCIDAGDNTAVPPDVYDIDGDSNTTERTPLDLDGISRFIDDFLTVDTGVPDLPDYPYIVDMGAYEYNP